ncbi:MAG: hypothetical protein ACRDNM_11610 [Gaiellaceae bacterium]
MILALKLTLTPAVMIGATLAGRRWGGAVSGWLIGLPLTSGPLVLVLALEHGRQFASRTALGSLSGAIAEAAFCVGYALAPRMPLVAASLGFAAAAAAVHALPLVALVAAVPIVLMLALRVLPPFPARSETSVRHPRWDLPARALVATGAVILLAAAATTIGARLTGLLAVYPLYSAVLAAFARRLEGRAAAVGLLRGLLVGLFSFAAFYSVLAFSLPRIGTGGAFAGAIAAALIVQAASLLRILRRPESRSERDLLPATPASPSPAGPRR